MRRDRRQRPFLRGLLLFVLGALVGANATYFVMTRDVGPPTATQVGERIETPLPTQPATEAGAGAMGADPALIVTARKGDRKAKLPPGPNGPVGTMWMALSKPHYGIHGTPEPHLIGRTQSSGCVRLTNWSATAVAAASSLGPTVSAVEYAVRRDRRPPP